MTEDSYVKLGEGGTTFVGPDAVSLAHAIFLKSALNLYARSKMLPSRNVNATTLLNMATAITGVPYRRGRHADAAADVKRWIDAMRAAIPIVRDD